MTPAKRKARAKAKAKAARASRGSRVGLRKQNLQYIRELRKRAREAIASGTIIYPEDQKEEINEFIQSEA